MGGRSVSAAGWVSSGALAFVVLGCASSHKPPQSAKLQGEPVDGSACAHICAASAACGDSLDSCEPKCREWLVNRSRPGIATATAKCAVPRIGGVCSSDEGQRSAASALVSCIDEAGRAALKVDPTALLVAARAICERGARCHDQSPADAERCVQKITYGARVPRGLGIFGAIKPELVQRFAQCMSDSSCAAAGGASSCFGEMLGEDPDDHDDQGDDEDDDDSMPPPPPPKTPEDGTKGGTTI